MQSEYYFSHSWLDPEEPQKCTADQYFKEISYFIDLNQIYNVLGTCYINDDVPYCPILVELSQEKIIKAYDGCSYLLQAWKKDQQRKVFEKPLKSKIKLWAVVYRYLIYTLEGEEEKDKIYIVDLDGANKTMIVKNFALDMDCKHFNELFNKQILDQHICLYGNHLYAASDNQIAVMFIEKLCQTDGETIDASGAQYKVRIIKTKLKILGLVVNGLANSQKFLPVAFESEDNQIEYLKLTVQNINDDAKFDYKYEGLRENNPRDEKVNDPIVKFRYTYSGGYMFGTILRKSGECDLYWNFMRIETVKNKSIVDIAMSFSTYYFRLENGTVYAMDHKQSAGLSFDQGKVIPSNTGFNIDKAYLKIVQNIVKPYVGFNILRTGNTGTIVVLAHGKFISTYSVLDQTWRKHCRYEDDILMLFRHYENDKDKYQSIILRNGAVYIGIINNDLLVDEVPIGKRKLKIEGEILKLCNDLENNISLYMLVKQDGKFRLDAIVRGKIHNVTVIPNLLETCSVVQLQTRGEETKVLIQNNNSMKLFTQNIKDGLKLDELKDFPDIKDKIKGQLLQGCSFNISKHMFLFDDKNMYVVRMRKATNDFKTYENLFCVGIQTISNNFNYALCQETATSTSPGLRFFDMESIIKKDKLSMTLLKKIDVGTLGYFENGITIERLGFLNSITSLIVTPILHKNIIRFMGMKPIGDYSLMNVVKDQFFALQGQTIETYNLFTGKFESKYEIEKEKLDMSKLVYSDRLKKGKVFFATKDPETVSNEKEFYLSWQLEPSMEKVTTFQQAAVRTYKKYYYLEIQGPTNVQIHLQFVHTHYAWQRMFVNDSHDRMITVLINYRTFLYSAEKIDPTDETKVKWNVIRQINPFPNELDNDFKFLEHFTPCFSRYMTYDKKNQQFVLRDNINGGVEILKFPKDVLSCDNQVDHIKWATNRIKWLDYSTIKIVNEEGIEKIYNVDNKFSTEGYNVIPMFNDIQGKEWETKHYYKERAQLTSDQFLERLKRKYQEYKSAYYLNPYCNANDLVNVMIQNDGLYTEASFTFVSWSLIEQLKDNVISLDELEPALLESVIYNIIPGGRTIFHALCNQKDELEKIMKICHTDDKIVFHLPFLPDFFGKTPIHILDETLNYKSINMLLQYLSLYPIDHHSRSIRDMYPKFVSHELPNFLDYIGKRFLQTKQIAALDKGLLVDDYPTEIVAQLWFEQKTIESQVFEVQNENKVTTSIKLQFIDLPGVYHYLDPNFQDFFKALAETTHYEYFMNKAIQSFIDFNYPLVQRHIVMVIVLPFLLFHAMFVCYTNLVYEHRNEDDNYGSANWAFAIALLGFSCYFLYLEIRQMGNQGMAYLQSVWNYIDILSPLGVIVSQILQISEKLDIEINQDFQRSILALATFFMWLKILYILRIFKSTGYLIRAIVEVIFDMVIFLFILFLTVITFGDSFLRLSYGNKDEELQFIPNFFHGIVYGYRMILGDFDTTAFGDVAVPLAYVFWFLCTILDMIVMLNLLIAIISDTYARVASNSEQAAYQEMTKLIDENQYLIPYHVKRRYAPQNQYLIVLENLEKIDDNQGDPILNKIEYLNKKLMLEINNNSTQRSNNLQEEINQLKKEVNVKLQAITNEVNSINTNQKNIQDFTQKALSIPNTDMFISKLHHHSLVKKQLKQLEKITSFSCNGNSYTGCKSDMKAESTEYKKEDAAIIHHCFTCGFDYCSTCFKEYGLKSHQHPLTEVKYELLQKLPKYTANGGWLCDARFYKGCQYGAAKSWNSTEDITYCCRECNYDLCDKCVIDYKA
eukprot:403364473